MTARKSRRPGPALIISVIALVMAMGGSSVAQDVVAEISAKIKGKQIAKNAITSKKVKNGSLKAKDIKSGQVLTPAAGNAAYQPKGNYQPAGSYLAANGKAADADKLDGIDSTGFLAADGKAADSEKLDGLDGSQYQQGQAYHGAATVAKGGADKLLFEIPGKLRLDARCLDGGDPDPEIKMTFLRDWGGLTRNNSGAIAHIANSGVENGDTNVSTGPAGAAQHIQWQLYREGAIGSEVIDINAGAGVEVDNCEFAAMATRRDSAITFIFTPPIVFDPGP